jgi:signal transduction histidine kinase
MYTLAITEKQVNILTQSLLILSSAIAIYFIIGYTVKKLIVRQKILKILIERRTREIQQKNEELEKNNLIKTRLISIISHDLITPLKYIHFTSKSLLENKATLDEETIDEMMTEVMNSSKELELISTNILNWIKYQNENRRLIKEEFDLHAIVNQIFSIFRGIAKQKDIALINEFNTDMILYQYMEPIRIVLYNLTLNAMNFTEKGSITVSGGKTTKGILIKVKDQGVGMSPEQIENIQSEQFIVSSINVDKRKGNGLGYLIIKDLLKLVDAKFVIKSKKNKGTMVTILLPV